MIWCFTNYVVTCSLGKNSSDECFFAALGFCNVVYQFNFPSCIVAKDMQTRVHCSFTNPETFTCGKLCQRKYLNKENQKNCVRGTKTLSVNFSWF